MASTLGLWSGRIFVWLAALMAGGVFLQIGLSFIRYSGGPWWFDSAGVVGVWIGCSLATWVVDRVWSCLTRKESET